MKGRSIVEQGAGRFDLDSFFEQMMQLETLPLLITYPYSMNLTEGSEYFLPFSRQRVYASMMPLGINFTLINRESSLFQIVQRPSYKIVSPNEQL